VNWILRFSGAFAVAIMLLACSRSPEGPSPTKAPAATTAQAKCPDMVPAATIPAGSFDPLKCTQFGGTAKRASRLIPDPSWFYTSCPVSLKDKTVPRDACRPKGVDELLNVYQGGKSDRMQVTNFGDSYWLTIWDGVNAKKSVDEIQLFPKPNATQVAWLQGAESDGSRTYYVYFLPKAVTQDTPPELYKHYIIEVYYKDPDSTGNLCSDSEPSTTSIVDCDKASTGAGQGDASGGSEPPPKR
jgi:hypothetical protein